MSESYQPVIIIGAPRSGTNMLRDMMVKLPGAGTWDCDEINYIWRHGNTRYPSDEFTPEMATPAIAGYIQSKFRKLAARSKSDVVIEKTCANSLRVGFVNRVIPDAKYIFIVRDGIDAVASARKRWRAGMDVHYILRKARYVPASDIGYYATRYLLNHIHRITSSDKRLSFWGPALDGMNQLLERFTLEQVCALQWKRCVDNSERDFASIPADRIFRTSYERFVAEPVSEFRKIADFIGKDVPDSANTLLRRNIRASSVGNGRRELGDDVISELLPLLEDALARYGY